MTVVGDISNAGALAGRDSTDLAVATHSLFKRYGHQPALLGLSMSVPRGKVYGFLGPNGSGKTTTLRLLVGLIKPDAGRMELLGRPFAWQDRRRLFSVGSMIETPAFYPYMSGRDNLRVVAATGAPTSPVRVDKVLDYVGLQSRANDKFNTYSLGMKQRLGIAAAMLSDPLLLILDEPANGLDPAGMAAMRETLRWLTEQGKTVLISSHLLSEIEQLADVVGIIDHGRLIKEGPLAELLAAAGRVRVRVKLEEMSRAAEILRPFAPDKQLYGIDNGPQAGTFTVSVEAGRASDINQTLAGAGIYASMIEPGSDLEHLFLQLTMPSPPGGPSAGSPAQVASGAPTGATPPPPPGMPVA